MEWAAAVEEVLDQLKINECSIVAHSAGAPYALAFANRAPNRIRGDLCLLAPWIGGSESGECWRDLCLCFFHSSGAQEDTGGSSTSRMVF
jgi:pimeloyl-ACP methyl ester carboxylesterase